MHTPSTENTVRVMAITNTNATIKESASFSEKSRIIEQNHLAVENADCIAFAHPKQFTNKAIDSMVLEY